MSFHASRELLALRRPRRDETHLWMNFYKTFFNLSGQMSPMILTVTVLTYEVQLLIITFKQDKIYTYIQG